MAGLGETGQWDEESWLERQLYRWLSFDNRLHLAFWIADSSGTALIDEGPPSMIVAWDGEAWYERLVDQQTVRILQKPPSAFEFDSLPMFNLCDLPALGGGTSLSDIMRTWDIVEQSAAGSSGRVVLTYGKEGLHEIELIFDVEPELRLLSLRYDIKVAAGEEHAGEIRARFHYHVQEWAEYDGMLLPKLAYRDGYSFQQRIGEPEGLGPRMVRTVLRRRLARDRSNDGLDASGFPFLLKSGDWVTDERSNLQYKLGSDGIIIDGSPYPTSELISGDPTSQLPRLIRTSSAAAPATPEHISTFAPESRSPWRRALIFGGITFIACFGGLAIARHLLGRLR